MNLEEIEKELEDIPLTEYEWDMIEWLIAEVKRLRKQIELEHDHGELFLTQIKDVRAEIEIERLKADLDGFIHGGL